MGTLALWWLAAEAAGIVALPLSALVLANLPDRGWGLARPFGLLVLGWLVWFPLSLFGALPYSRGWIAGTLVAFALANAALLRRPAVRGALLGLLRRERGYVLAGEAVFAGSFALMGWERSFTPAVVDTEKFMDVAFLSAIWRTPHLPPPDPWLAGQPINYYYYGHYLLATLAKLLGTEPAVAFNSGVALTFALTASAVFAVAANLVALVARAGAAPALRRAIPFGLAAVALVLVLGNLDGAVVWWKQAVALAATPGGLPGGPLAWWTHPALWTQYDWWSPSRVVNPPNTINEFPAFSFVLADLHAHVLALPYAALALGVALNLLLAGGLGLRAFGDRWPGMLALGVSALTLGSLYAINGWDLPTYLGLALLALGIQQWLAHGRAWSTLFALDYAAAGVMLAALAVLLFLPFYGGFSSPAQGFGLVPTAARSPIGQELAIFALPAFIVGSLLAVRLAADVGRHPLVSRAAGAAEGAAAPARSPIAPPALLAGTALLLLALWTLLAPAGRDWTLLWSLVFLAGCAAVVLRVLAPSALTPGALTPGPAPLRGRGEVDLTPGPSPAGRGEAAERMPGGAERADIFVWCLAGTAAALVAFGEVVYLRDVFAGSDAFRMNTVFKFYYQAWLLLGVAAGAALAVLLPRARAVVVAALTPGPEQTHKEDAEDMEVRRGPRPMPPGPHPQPLSRGERGAGAEPGGEGGAGGAGRGYGTARAGRAWTSLLSGPRLAVAWRFSGPPRVAAPREGELSAGPEPPEGSLAASISPRPRTGAGMRATSPRPRTGAGPGMRAPQPGGRGEPPVTPAGGKCGDGGKGGDGGDGERVAGDWAGVDDGKGGGDWGDGDERPGAPPRRAPAIGVALWLAALLALVAAAAVYPVQAVAARTADLSLPRSLDGTAYMASDPLNAGDAPAIAWLDDPAHVSGDPVIVEASGGEYTHYDRVSAFTGLPTILGWAAHEYQWRANWLNDPAHAGEIAQRLDAVKQIYTSADPGVVRALLARYHVRYVYVGAAERQMYPGVSLDRFASFLKVVYRTPAVTIYRVV